MTKRFARQSPWASIARPSWTRITRPARRLRRHFTPCAIPFGCTGDEWYEYDPDAAREILEPLNIETTIQFRDVVRGYLPLPTQVATEIQAQLADIGVTASLEPIESTAFIDAANAGELDGIHLLGWGADYPDATNFLDFHFGSGASPQFGEKFDDITAPLATGASSVEDADREAAYVEANNAVRTHVPMIPIAHGGSGTAWQADVEGAHSSPLGNESMAVIGPGADDQLVWMQNGEPGGLYCADETDGESLRVCEQIMEALYAYEVGGTAAIPSLAEECVPNDTLDEWTCTLRSGVTFHDGAITGRERRRPELRRAVGCRESAARRPNQHVRLLLGPVGWVPEPATAGGVADQLSERGAANGGAPFVNSVRLGSNAPVRPAQGAAEHPGPARDHLSRLRARTAAARRPVHGRARRAGDRGHLQRLHSSIRPGSADPGPVRRLPRPAGHGRSRRARSDRAGRQRDPDRAPAGHA